MTFKEQVDTLVRNHPANKELMELGKGCFITENKGMVYEIFKLYPPIKIGMEWRRGALTDNGQLEDITAWEILGHPPQLQHYLRVLATTKRGAMSTVGVLDGRVRDGLGMTPQSYYMTFNLTTGAPATEEDAEAFIKLLTP